MGTGEGTEGARRFKVRAVAEVEGVPSEERWLIDSLWAAQGVGIVGGTPKTGKTWAALELAVSVASGTAAFGRFDVREQGAVLYFPAEDRVPDIRERIEMLCRHRGIELEGLPLLLLEADRMHIDDEDDRLGLEEALEHFKPKLLVLDPFVRVHQGAENNTDHISRVLRYLREVQRKFSVGVMLTHHLSKKGKGSSVQHGQALRGSGDLHAWGDSNLYLSRLEGGVVELVAEHRQARPFDEPLYYRLATEGDAGRLELVNGSPDEHPEDADGQGLRSVVLKPKRRDERPVAERVLELLEERAPLSQVAMRKVLRVRNQALTEVLRALAGQGTVERLARGWALTAARITTEEEQV